MAAGADRAASAAAILDGLYSAAVYGLCRTAWRSRVWRRPGIDCRLGKIQRAGGGGHWATKRARYEAKGNSEFRAAQDRGLPESAQRNADDGQNWPAEIQL